MRRTQVMFLKPSKVFLRKYLKVAFIEFAQSFYNEKSLDKCTDTDLMN